MTPEFSRTVRAHEIGGVAWPHRLEASAAECAALAARFELLALDALTADLAIVRDAAGIRLTGQLHGVGAQACVVSAEPVGFTVDEALDLRFADAAVPEGDEIELGVPDLDTLPLEGGVVDMGEAVAQSFGLALDPYPRAAADVRAAVAPLLTSEEEAAAIAAADKARANPFAMLRPAK